jgi:hypothetical protein
MAIIEDRPPIIRAASMAIIYLLALTLYRRVALVNVVSLAAVAILLFRPSEIAQASFQLSFLAAGIIAAVAQPLLERTAEPYHRALQHLSDVTRNGSYTTELRLDLVALGKNAFLAALETRVLCGSYRCVPMPGWAAAVGIDCTFDRSPSWNAFIAGPRFPSRLFHCADCKHSCRVS